jgi:hypothetical protein
MGYKKKFRNQLSPLLVREAKCIQKEQLETPIEESAAKDIELLQDCKQCPAADIQWGILYDQG